MSSSQRENVLINLLKKRRWYEAMSRTNTEEGREEMRRKGWEGRLPLHWACRLGAPFVLVEAMLEGYPESVRVTDRFRQFPLHVAFWPRRGRGVISPPVLRLLLDAYPEGAKAFDRDGDLPLHKAADNEAPLEVLTMLIEAHPEGVTTCDRHGRLPVHRLANTASINVHPEGVNTRNSDGQLSWHGVVEYLYGSASPDKDEDLKKVELLFRPLLDDEDACLVPDPFRSGRTPLDIGARFDLLRLLECMRIPRCPATAITTVAKRHPEQLREMGEDGSLPLHLAAANPNLNGAEDEGEDIISKWIRLYPDAAAASDGEGRSPLNLAIESGKGWKEGVEAIADAAKGVRTIRDVGTNLFPFMLAASGANPCITTVYELLRCCPHMCKKP